MQFSSLKDHLKAARQDYREKGDAHKRTRAAFDSEAAKLRKMQERRADLHELVERANDEAETLRARVRSETVSYLDGAGVPQGIGDASRALKAAEAQAADLAAALDEADGPIEIQRQRTEAAGKALLDAHRLAEAKFARCEALSTIIETFPALRRAQRIAFACDARCDAAGLVRSLPLLPDSWNGPDETLTDGRGSRNALMNEIRRAGATA